MTSSRRVGLPEDRPIQEAEAADLAVRLPVQPLHAGTDSPAAVLMVQARTRQVVYANPLARQLAPGVTLPTSIDEWATAAELLDPDGRPLGKGNPDLSALVDVPPGPGRTVTALRASAQTAAREALYVVSLPLEGAPGLDGSSLIVLLPVRDQAAVASATREASAAHLIRERALLATGHSFTLADARHEDLPLIWVNPAFTQTTGYPAAEALGRNCRFLQGPQTDRGEVARLRAALESGEDITVVLLNYRRDGSTFWNQVSVTPVLNAAEELTHFVGVQTDVTERVEVERSLQAAYQAERVARADAEEAVRTAEQLRDRIATVAEATGILAATLDVSQALDRLQALLVPAMADMAVITLVDDVGRPTVVAGRHRRGHEDLVARWCEMQRDAVSPGSATERALRTGQPVLVRDIAPDTYLSAAIRPEHLPVAREIFTELGLSSAIVVPLLARRRVVGVLALLTDGPGRTFDEQDLQTASDLGRRAALAIDNARLYELEHDTALTLQRSLLPRLPQIPGLQVAAAYLPGNDRAEVGGDWWDVFALKDGVTGVAIGDVMGHDISAAAAMGQLRSVLRTSAWLGQRPADVLDTMDHLVHQFEMAQLATTLVARVEPAGPDHPVRFVWSNAGHLPPILLPPDGPAEVLRGDVGVPIGAPAAIARVEQVRDIAAGSTLLLYTDGLVESREHDIDVDIDNLLARVGAHDPDDHPQDLVDLLTSALTAVRTDDVALLALKVE